MSEPQRESREYFEADEVVSDYSRSDLKPNEGYIFDRYFSDPGRVLVLGCGAGRVVGHLSNRGHEIVGVDLSTGMVDTASDRFDSRFAAMDASSLGFSASTFDYVFFPFNGIDFVHPVENRHRVFAEVRRVLRTGGLFVYSSHNRLGFPFRPTKWPSFLRTLLRSGNVFKRYWTVETGSGPIHSYRGTPWSERRALAGEGLRLLDSMGPKRSPLKWLQESIYYVATVDEHPDED